MSMMSSGVNPTTNQIGAINITLAKNGIRLPRATGGPVLDLDLMTMAKELRCESAWSDGRNSRTLVKHGDFRMILTVMRAGARLHRHHARGTVLIQVLTGHLRTRVLGELFDASAGHALSLDPNLEHDIEALDESAVLITIAWPQGCDFENEPIAASRMRRFAAFSSIADNMEAAARPESGAR